MSSSADPTEQLRAHFQWERQDIDRHPSPELIAAYHERRLPPDEMEEVRAHLAACRDCTAELQELADLLAAEGDPVSGISRADLDAAWQRQRSRLFPGSPVVPLQGRRAGSPPLRRAWATAAFLGMAAALLAVIVVGQRRTIALLEQPQANPPLVNLAPVDSGRQGLRELPEVRLPGEAGRIWLILNPSAELDFSSYDIELIAPDGAVTVRFEDVRSSEAGNFRLEVPRGVLEAGRYRVLLTGKKSGKGRVVEEFALRVRPASP